MTEVVKYRRCRRPTVKRSPVAISWAALIWSSVILRTEGLSIPRLCEIGASYAPGRISVSIPMTAMGRQSIAVQRRTNNFSGYDRFSNLVGASVKQSLVEDGRCRNGGGVFIYSLSGSASGSRLVTRLHGTASSFDVNKLNNNPKKEGAGAGDGGTTANRSTGSGSGSGSVGMYGGPPNVDAMVARAGKLRQSIREQQLELQRLENQLVCCTDNDSNNGFFSTFKLPANMNFNNNDPDGNNQIMEATLNRAWRMFGSSTRVLIRKLERVRNKQGPNNQRYDGSMSDYFATEMATIPRIVNGFVQNPNRIRHLVDPSTPTLIPHVPAILSRLDKLESHVAPILERVLNNRRHLASIEPYLPEILERFDDIEPHLPWILDNIDALAPNTGLLLKHIDELLLYADCDDEGDAADPSRTRDQYALAKQLLPYLEYYVSRLDVIGPHLPLLRPHIPLLLRHDRIGKISPHIDRLFARGYKDLSASVNMDVLLFWFGWTLRIPGLPRLFFALPRSPWVVSFLANRLPKRFVRGRCSGVTCVVDNDYGYEWNNLKKDDDG